MKLEKTLRMLVVLAMALGMALPAVQVAQAAPPGGSTTTYWVNDPGDLPDANPGDNICDTGTGALPGTSRLPCTLRAAIQEANATAGAQVIAFEICPSDGFTTYGDVAGSYRISPATPLPAVTGGLTYFNGYTQGNHGGGVYDDPSVPPAVCDPGNVRRNASPNTNSFSQALNTVLAIEIDGALCVTPAPENDADQTTPVAGGVVPSGSILRWNGTAGACSGFTVTSDRNVFAGLNIRNWRNAGILIMPLTQVQADKPSENTVWGSFIGTNIEGTAAAANRFGVEIIGKADANYIGDTYAIPSWLVGDATWIEEPTNNERNLFSGNDNPYFVYGYTCQEGGFYTRFRDDGAGIFMGVDPCVRTNGPQGVTQASIFVGGAIDNHVRNSYIGTDFQGSNAVPNSVGVWLNYDAGRGDGTTPGNHIGGCVGFPFTPGALAIGCIPQTVDEQQDPNLISGNRRLVGGGASQTLGGHGIWLNGFTSVANHREGLYDVSYNEMGGNFIGVDGTGTAKLPNSGNGVFVLSNTTTGAPDGPDHNEVGATTRWVPQTTAYRAPYAGLQPYRYGNLISGNGNASDEDNTFGQWDNGVEIRGFNATDNHIGYGNAIGLNSQGTASPTDVGNGESGVFITSGATLNYVHNNSGSSISTRFPPATNDIASTFGAISDNGDFAAGTGRHGVRIANEATLNHVFRNCIGGDAADTAGGSADDCDGADSGNHDAGVSIEGGALYNWVGLYNWSGTDSTDRQDNWIHDNGGDGVQVIDTSTHGTVIRFNRIWLNGNPTDGDLGIDLVGNNDTLNDVGDNDSSSNYEQNYPNNIVRTYPWLISFDEPDGCDLVSSSDCRIDIYAILISESDDPLNHGEGRYWLLSSENGNVTNLDISSQVYAAMGNPPAGDVCITLTTTRNDEFGLNASDRNTSEYSPCMPYTPTAVTLSNVTARSNAPMIGVAVAAALALSGAGLFAWRRKKSQ